MLFFLFYIVAPIALLIAVCIAISFVLKKWSNRPKSIGIILLVIGIVILSVGSYYYIDVGSQGGDEGSWGRIMVLLVTLPFGIPSFIAGIQKLIKSR